MDSCMCNNIYIRNGNSHEGVNYGRQSSQDEWRPRVTADSTVGFRLITRKLRCTKQPRYVITLVMI